MAVAVLCGGCATTGTVDPVELETPFDEIFRSPGSNDAPVAHGVVVGLTKVIPKYYDGWAGDCPGSDYDASMMSQYCKDNGIVHIVLRDHAATKARVEEACRAAARGLRPDKDLLFLYFSGHGGQLPDTDADEEDAMDETLCLADGQMVDDYVRGLMAEAPANLWVAFITDSCNSKSNYRAVRSYQRAMGDGQIKCRVIHIGGCSDGEASEGSDQGGNLTLALMAVLKDNPTWWTWRIMAQPKMWGTQRASYEEWNVTDEFRNAGVKR